MKMRPEVGQVHALITRMLKLAYCEEEGKGITFAESTYGSNNLPITETHP